MILLLILLIIIPIASYKWAKFHRPDYKITILGISFGAIVAPFSMGLYATFFLHWLGLVTGMLGLVMVMFHGALGYEVSIQLGLIPSGIVTTTSSNIIIAAINGFSWGAIYGVIGYFIDKYRKHRQNPNKSFNLDGANNAPPS